MAKKANPHKTSKKKPKSAKPQASSSSPLASTSNSSIQRSNGVAIMVGAMAILLVGLGITTTTSHPLALFSDTKTTKATTNRKLTNKNAESTMKKQAAKKQPQQQRSRRMQQPRPLVPIGRYQVLERLPHDANAFTQGLTYHDGTLYESTGMYGDSQIRILDPLNYSQPLQHVEMERQYFGEGMAHYYNRTDSNVKEDGQLIVLTWKERTGFIYKATSTLDLLHTFHYDTATGEGWGITHEPSRRRFIVSDGSEWLHFWDDVTLEELGRVQVTINVTKPTDSGEEEFSARQSVKQINELEYVNGRVLANVWYTDQILSIHPETGEVDRVYDFSDLWPRAIRSEEAGGKRVDCFNGISVTDKKDELLVTGKWWPFMFRVKLLDDSSV